MNIEKFVGEPEDILEKLYDAPLIDEVHHEVFDFKAYLALEPTEEYKNNQTRIKREQDEAKGIFVILSNSLPKEEAEPNEEPNEEKNVKE